MIITPHNIDFVSHLSKKPQTLTKAPTYLFYWPLHEKTNERTKRLHFKTSAEERLAQVHQRYLEEQAKLEKERQNVERLKQDIETKELTKKEEIDKLYKRETDLYKYKFKIKDLKKSRHVLTHRAKEMQASLQPKEEQIDNLKD